MKILMASFGFVFLIFFISVSSFYYAKFCIQAENEINNQANNAAIDSIRNVVLEKNEKLFKYKVALDSLKSHHNEEIKNLPNLDYNDLYERYWIDNERHDSIK